MEIGGSLRIAAVASMLLLLAACHSTQDRKSPAYSAPAVGVSTGLFQTRTEAAIASISKKVGAECARSANSGMGAYPATGDLCARPTLLRIFDTTGAIESICSSEISFGEFTRCVMLSAIVRELFFGYGEEPTIRRWYDLNEVKREFTAVAMKRDAAPCLSESGDASVQKACMLKSFADHMRIRAGDAEKCGAIADLRQRAGCLSEAAIAEYLEETDQAF